MKSYAIIFALYSLIASLMIVWLSLNNMEMRETIEFLNRQNIGDTDPNRMFQFDLPELPVIGEPDAPVEFVYFTDYQCPFCAAGWDEIRKFQAEHTDKIRVRVALLPRMSDPHQAGLAAGALAASNEGLFAEVHDWLALSQGEVNPETLAEAFHLPSNFFTMDNLSPVNERRISTNFEVAQNTGIRGVPALFINGRRTSVNRKAMEAMLSKH